MTAWETNNVALLVHKNRPIHIEANMHLALPGKLTLGLCEYKKT